MVMRFIQYLKYLEYQYGRFMTMCREIMQKGISEEELKVAKNVVLKMIENINCALGE